MMESVTGTADDPTRPDAIADETSGPRRAPAGPTTGPTDDVVRRAIAGDRFALGELWDAYNPGLVRFLAGLRVREPDDVAAEVWVDLARRMPAVGADVEAFRRVLYTVARRRAIDAHRRFRRRPVVTLDPVAPLPVADPGRTVEELVGDEVTAQRLLAALPRAQAEVVALRIIGGFSAAEVAAMTGRSEGAVRITAMRGLRRLRELAIAAGLAESRTDEAPTTPGVTDPDPEAMVES